MRLSGLTLLLLVSAALCREAVASQDIYSYTNSDGEIFLSNVPSDTRYETVVSVPVPPVKPESAGVKAPSHLLPLVSEAARSNDVDEALLHAVIAVESGYDPRAVSSKGAVGLMQLMPKTARRYHVANSYDPAQNVSGGARYLKDLISLFKNDLQLALAAYNAGEEAVIQRGNRIPPYRETQRYVPRVLELYHRMKASGEVTYY